jgi:peptidoglycan/LPS O-acetylase OafA/YrhL
MIRAFAAVSVCLFHFSRNDFLGAGWGQRFCSYGYLGVDSFFVVSGFVIPLSLYQAKYCWKGMPAFLLRRFLRLYPAFLAACALVIGLVYLSGLAPGFRGSALKLDWTTLICNLTLSCGIFERMWINPAFWTLAVEAQFYLFIALAFPLLTDRRVVLRTAALVLWILAPLIVRPGVLALGYGALFSMGTLVFLRRVNLIAHWTFLLLLAMAFFVEGFGREWGGAFFGLASASLIAFAPAFRGRAVLFMGGISYSLYLVHVPIGGRIINLAERLPAGPFIRAAAVGVALLVSVVFAYGFFRLVESPSHRLAKRIRPTSRAA